jgi:hypothetical protein
MTRHLFLDDAFIHLRIARNIVNHGFYSFNGDEPTYSTSSPLYTYLLAIFWEIQPSSLILKYINVATYLLLFVMLSNFILAAKSSSARMISILWLMAISSPMAIRWLTDGMETVAVAITAIVLGKFASDLVNKKLANADLMAYFIVCFFATMLRVEFLFVIALIVSGWVLNLVLNLTKAETDKTTWPPITLLLGGLFGVVTVWWMFGYVLSDAAVAKAGMSSDLSLSKLGEYLFGVIRVHVAASFFGLATAICWLWSAFELVKEKKNVVYSVALNSGFLVLFLLIVFRQQALQGYRYFIFIEFFLTAYNIYSLRRCEARVTDHKVPRLVILVACVLIAGWQFFDFTRLEVINSGRSLTYARFSNSDLSYLNKEIGIAWDVGMIGYFSDGYILDPQGLVNGRKYASMKGADRLSIFPLANVDFVFANQEQIDALKPYLNVNGWTEVGQFDFPNFNKLPDTHYLLVRRI